MIQIGAYIAAISTITASFAALLKFTIKVSNKIDSFEGNLKENTLSTLRLVITNEKMPLSERLNAGKKYVDLGGNGEVHALYDLLEKKYKEKMEEKI